VTNKFWATRARPVSVQRSATDAGGIGKSDPTGAAGAPGAIHSGGPLEQTAPRARTGLGLAVVMTGVLITAVDTTIVVLALPEIERGLHVALASVIWVIIGYLLVITLLASQVGRLGDMFGRVRMYEAGFVVFIVGSALCALSWNEDSIIVFRVLQGIGAALVTANSGAVIADLFPPDKRGKAYGFNGMGYSLGAVLGIVIGGLIVTYVSWRWIFWINVPIGVVAVFVALRVLHDTGSRQRRRVDVAGMLSAGLGLFGILWAATNLATRPIDASLLLVPGYLIGGAVGPLSGRMADMIGPVVPATAGLAIQVVALFVYAHLGLSSGLWLVIVGSVLNGIGASTFFPANSSAVMKASPPQVFGVSSGMLRTFQNTGMVFSFSMAILIASRSIPRQVAFAIFVGTAKLQGHVAAVFTNGLHAAFYASMGFLLLAAVLSATRGRHGFIQRDARRTADSANSSQQTSDTIGPGAQRSLPA